MDYGWEEVDEEKTEDCTVEIDEVPEAGSHQGHSQTETEDAQNVYDLFFVDSAHL